MSTKTFGRFVQGPTLERYLRLRRQVMQTRRYDPQAVVLGELQAQLEADPQQVLRRTKSLAASFRLSPRFHFLAGQAAMAAEQWDLALEHREASRACLGALLDSGHGTRSQPHLVTYLTDARDLAVALGRSVRCQELVQVGNRSLDVLTTHDGQQLWFDVSDLLTAELTLAVHSEASNV